jgi:hypothetical protein
MNFRRRTDCRQGIDAMSEFLIFSGVFEVDRRGRAFGGGRQKAIVIQVLG